MYLENIHPNHLDLLKPLASWKILNLNTLKKFSKYKKGSSSFYKTITKLEENLLIDSFIDSWGKEKFVYLTQEGFRAIGYEDYSCEMKRDERFHNAYLVQACIPLYFLDNFKEMSMHAFRKTGNSFHKNESDARCLFECYGKDFNLAIELELNQKSKNRVENIFKLYNQEENLDFVLYISHNNSLLNTYKNLAYNIFSKEEAGMFGFLHVEELHNLQQSLLNLSIEVSGIKDFKLMNIIKYGKIHCSSNAGGMTVKRSPGAFQNEW